MSFGLAFPPASQQNSSPTPAPDPKPTMIDDWAVSVKPSADPTIIKKHIEKMVEVSCFLFFFFFLLPPTRPASFLLTMQVTLRGLEVVRGILHVVPCTKTCITATQLVCEKKSCNPYLLIVGQRIKQFFFVLTGFYFD